MSDETSAFVIELDAQEATEARSLGSVDSLPVLERVKRLMLAILAKLKEMLKGNLPEWKVVEAGVIVAFNQYIRPLSIPDWIDDIFLNALLAKAKEIYAEFA